MAATFIGDPGIGRVNATSADDRYAGVNKVRSDGTVAARHEAGLQMVQGAVDTPTYVVNFNVAATAALDILTLGAPANKVLRLKRIAVENPGSATAAIIVDLQLGIATAAGSGGAAATPQSLDQMPRVAGVTGGPDPAFAGTARTGDTTQAAGFVAVYNPLQVVSVPAAAGAANPGIIYTPPDLAAKSLTAANGNVIVFRTPAIGAGATGFRGWAEFTVDDA